MPQNHSHSTMETPAAFKLEDFGKLQERYQSLSLAERAQAALNDAEPALQAADKILAGLAAQPKIKPVFDKIRKNHALVGKMRPSEAKNILMDSSNDFIAVTRHKLAAWRKTMQRISQGEGIVREKNREYIPAHLPVAMAVAGIVTASNYLSMAQIALSELSQADDKSIGQHTLNMAKIRRCATVLSDCELASSIGSLVN